MIYFLYGPDTFRIRERLRVLTAELESSGPINRRVLSFPRLSADDFAQATTANSLFGGTALVVVEDLLTLGNRELQEQIFNLLEKLPVNDDSVIVFTESSVPDRRTRLFKLLNQKLSEEYVALKPLEAKSWLQSRSHDLSLTLSPAAANALLRDFSTDLWRLNQELTKLSHFSGKDKADETTLDQLVPPVLSDKIFLAIEALANRDIALANQLINSQLALGMNEQQLLTMVAYQFRNILIIKSLIDSQIPQSQLAAKSGLHPYVVKKTVGFAQKFSISQLKRIFDLLHRIDVAIKNGTTPPKVGLDILTAQIINS